MKTAVASAFIGKEWAHHLPQLILEITDGANQTFLESVL